MPRLRNRYGRWRPLCGLLFALTFFGGSPARAAEPGSGAAAPLWPLDLPTRYLTSNFMEHRSGRFHAGLDLRTQTKSGFAARAVEAGSIIRVRATPFAYGRSIYLLGESGRTYVYAHLSRFSDPVRARVRAAQAKSGTYRTRLELAPGQMTVKRGEVLALTGESGTSGPHLHFEVRDPANGPVNPLAVGFAVPDTFAPVIHAVRAIPADPDSRINGSPVALLLKPEPADGKGLSGEQAPLQIHGPVAFAAKIIDASDIRGFKLEPWLIEVLLDGELVYRCRNDRFDFFENSLQRLEWLEIPGIRDRWLHRRSGNSLTGRQGEEWFRGPDGSGLAAGDHELLIRTADFAGNETSLVIPLQVLEGGDAPLAAQGRWMADPVTAPVDSLPGNELRPLVDNGHELSGDAVLRVLHPDAGDPVLARTRLAIVPATLGPEELSAARRQGLDPLGAAGRYVAADWPIDAAVRVNLTGTVAARSDTLDPAGDPAVGVYRWSGSKWKSAGRVLKPASGERFHRFALSSPGFYAVFADETGPVIFPADTVVSVAVDPRGESFGITLSHWKVFPLDLMDRGSGIAPESIETLLDGQPLVVEPDLPRDRVLVELPDDLAPGRHVLLLKARDEAGNESQNEVLIECRE